MLSSQARRRSLQLKLQDIERKIVRTQEEIYQLEQGASWTPDLFGDQHPTLAALRQHLEHLEKVAKEIRQEIGQR